MDGPSAHDEMARAIRTAIGLLEDEEMAVAETRVEAALWTLRPVSDGSIALASDLDAAWNAFSLRPENCHMCDVDGKCALHKPKERTCREPGCSGPGVEESRAFGGYWCAWCWDRLKKAGEDVL